MGKQLELRDFLGIIAKHSGKDLIVKVYSIMDLTPVRDVTLKLLSYENQIIKKAETDNSGECVIKDWKINRNKFN